MITTTKEVKDFTRVLPVGKKNAISADDLCQAMGFNDTRTMRAYITAARRAGQFILSSSQGGYFLLDPNNEDEIQEYVNYMSKRGISSFVNIKAVREWLKNKNSPYYHQINIYEFLEEIEKERE